MSPHQQFDEVLESDENSAEQPIEPSVPTAGSIMRQQAPINPWVHFFAGGVAGMAGAVVTSPLDVVKTRLQSDLHHSLSNKTANGQVRPRSRFIVVRGLRHVTDTFGIIADVYKTEGFRALFRGLGPNLAGVVPARSVNFFTYGLAKNLIAPQFNDPEQLKPQTHLASGVTAGIVTSTVTNPIWLVKTRLQLDKAHSDNNTKVQANGAVEKPQRLYKNSFDCARKIIKNEGFFALYRGLTASFLGSSESSMQWVLYEQMKSFIRKRQEYLHSKGHQFSRTEKFMDWFATSGAAGAAKFIASLITYPHEVVRTRLRQAPQEGGKPKYTGLIQCFRRVIAEEGLASLYGGLTPHLLRTVPNSIIMFGTWDLIVRFIAGRPV